MVAQVVQATFGHFQRRLFVVGKDHEIVVAEPRDRVCLVHGGRQDAGDLGQHLLGTGEAAALAHVRVVRDRQLHKGMRRLRILRLTDQGIQSLHKGLAIEKAGLRILAGEFFNSLLQGQVLALIPDHDLSAALAIDACGRKFHECAENLAVTGDATEFLGVFAGLVHLSQGGLECATRFCVDHVHDRQPIQLVGGFVAEHVQVGLVGVQIHALVNVRDGVT